MLFNAHLSNGWNFVELVVTEKWIFQIYVSIGGDGYPFYSSNYGWIGEWMVICCEKYKSQSRKQPYSFLNYSYRKKTQTKTLR